MTSIDSLEEKLDALAPHCREVEFHQIQNYWLKLDTWSLSEAALLSLGIDPNYIATYIDDPDRDDLYGEIGDLYGNVLLVAGNCEGISLSIQRIDIDTNNQDHCWWDNKVNPREFTQWAKTKGLYVSRLLDSFLVQDTNQLEATSSDSENSSDHPRKNKPKLRVEEIHKAAVEKFDDPMKIPYRGKTELRRDLCHQKPELFTKDTFDVAWKIAKKEKLLEIENVEKYKPGK